MKGSGGRRGFLGSRLDWAAVGALGGVAAAVIALLAYALPPGPYPTPPGAGPEVPPTPVIDPPGSDQPEPGPTTPRPGATTPQTADPRPDSSWSLVPLLPAGCEEALAVVDRYYRTAGSTKLSQQAAATEAYQGMMGASLNAEGAVYSVTVALSQNFSEMRFILSGMVSGDYPAVQARTRRDAQTLRDVCDADP